MLAGHSPEEDDDLSRHTGSGHSDSGSVTHKHRPKTSSGYNGAPKSSAAALATAASSLPGQWLEKRKALQVGIEYSEKTENQLNFFHNQARLRRLDDQLALVRSAPLVPVAPSPFGPPSRGVTPPIELSRFSRPPSVWPAYGDGGFSSPADRRSVDAVTPMAAKRKAGVDRWRSSEAKRQRGGPDPRGENRLVPTGRMRNAFQHCSKLLDTLMKDRASKAYFNAPVDYVALGTPQLLCQLDLLATKQDLVTL